MSVWEKYENRIRASGLNRREATLKREINFLNQKLPNSLSYHTVVINDLDQNVAIINTDILTEKFIYSLPGETLSCGALVSWENNFWIITEKDVSDEVYTKAKMEQCNYLLKWVDSNAVIHEQWCIIEDGTKLRHSLVPWFGVLETARKKNSFLCWNPLRALLLNRSGE